MRKVKTKYRYGAVLLVVMLCLQGCKKNDVEPYNGTESVYFQLGSTWGAMPDSIVYTFYERSEEPKQEKLVNLKVSLLGNPLGFDRQVKIELDAEVAAREDAAVPGVDYEALPATVTMPAGEISTVIPVRFLYNTKLDTEEKQLGIYLRENEDFGLKLPGRDHIRLFISNMPPRPSYWGDTGITFGHFGPYSRVKQATIEEVLDVIFPDTYDEYSKESYKWSVRGTYMNQWFVDNPTVDENGKIIERWK